MTKLEAQHPPGTAADDHEPQFRAVRLGGKRRGFKLEASVWRALEAIAAQRGHTLAEELEQRLESAGDAENQSSRLRSGVVSDLLNYWRITDLRAARFSWAPVVEALPTAAFAIDDRSRMLACNEPLAAHLRARGVLPPGHAREGISVDVPGSVIAEVAGRSRGAVQCKAVFRCAGHSATLRVRLMAVSTRQQSGALVFGFIDG